MKRYPRLANVLFEAPEDELEKFMSQPLSSLGSNPAEKLPPEAKELVKKPTGDDDKKIQGGTAPTFISVTKLLASQNEVGKAQSLKNVCTGVDASGWDGINWGDPKWLIDHMKPGAKIEFKSALLGAKTTDGNVVLDGHHRWSQAFMVNPNCQVNVVFANAKSLSADETLKAVHLAILAKTGQDKTKSATGGNLFTATADDVTGYLDAAKTKIDPKSGAPSDDGVAPYVYAIMKTKGIDSTEEGKKAAVDYIMSAIQKCASTVVSGAPSRDAMPQADDETNPVDASAVMDALGKGEINFQEPFIKKEEINKKDTVVMERWQRLAGILKD